MISSSFRITTLIAIAGCGAGRPPRSADEAYAAARFEEAATKYRDVERSMPGHVESPLRLAQIALLHDRLDEAESELSRAAAIDPASHAVAALQAEILVRHGAYAKAAPAYRAAGNEARARQLESFGDKTVYQVDGPPMVEIPFVMTDPLPLIEARGPDGKPLTFIIDTGGADLVLDPHTAAALELPSFGATEGTFAGGKTAKLDHATLGSLQLGGVTVTNLPVSLLDLSGMAGVFDGKHVDGIIGTVLLYQFAATLDYPRGRLVLRRRGDAQCDGMQEPMLLGADHMILAKGTLGSVRDQLWLVDTGLAGAGFTAPQTTLDRAGIVVAGVAKTGVGGGGQVTAVPFVVPELSLGPISGHDVPGVYGIFVDHMLDYHVDGLVSHAFLRDYAVTFDFRNMRLCFAR